MITDSYRGRIAPTPSGFLHIGHAATFKTAWLRARQRNGKLILRIEDIDKTRSKKEYIDQIIPDLKKIDLDWDEGCDIGGKYAPYLQSERTNFYIEALKILLSKNLIYPCDASRAQIKELSSLPERPMAHCESEAIFPHSLRPKYSDIPREISENLLSKNWRFIVAQNRAIKFKDELLGTQSFITQVDFGDFLVWRKSGEPSYEFAVVCDDIAMQITEVVRGADLLLSTARQILLYEAFGAPLPRFAHCPILTDASGAKLSKSGLMQDYDNPNLIKNLPEF